MRRSAPKATRTSAATPDAGSSREVENSLRRLNTDWIDLYQVHRPDPHTDIEETLGALTDLQRQGKIRAFGSSTFPAHQIVEAQWVSERRGLGRFVTEQPPYSLLVRGHRGRRAAGDARSTGWVCCRGARWPAAGSPGGTARARSPTRVRRRSRMPARYDMSSPDNQRKLDAADALGLLAEDAGSVADSPRAGIRDAASGSHRADHRPAHHGPPEVPARRGRRHAVRATSSTGSTRSCRLGRRSLEPIRAISRHR